MDVKKLRIDLNLTQQELADKTGIPKERIAKWEQGKGSPKLADHNKLAKLSKEFVPQIKFKKATSEKEGSLPGILVQLMRQQNQLITVQNSILKEQKEDIKDRITRLDANLNIVLGKSEVIQYELISGREVVLRSLARLEGFDREDHLLVEADKKIKFLAESKSEHYSSGTGGRKGR